MTVAILIEILDEIIEKDVFFTYGDLIEVLSKLEDLFFCDGFTLDDDDIGIFFIFLFLVIFNGWKMLW
jgi:hypothetical protein